MCDQPAEKAVLLRVFGGIVLLFSVGELIVDMVVYRDLTNPKVGAWWAAVVIVVSSVLALISTSRGVVIACMILSVSNKLRLLSSLSFFSFHIV
jgi:hypothetical protein